MATKKKRSAKTSATQKSAAHAPAARRDNAAHGPWASLATPRVYFSLLGLAIVLILASLTPSPEHVSVDFLFSKTCDYCMQAQPRVEAAVAQMGGRVSLTYWDAANRATDPATAQLYANDRARGLFGGFPTLVAHGAKGDDAQVGLVSEQEVKDWLCQQFVHPPAACSQ